MSAQLTIFQELGPRCFLPLVSVTHSVVLKPFDVKWELYITQQLYIWTPITRASSYSSFKGSVKLLYKLAYVIHISTIWIKH